MPIPLVDSPLLFEVSDDDPVGTVSLTPASFASWTACWAAHPTAPKFKLSKGNYLPWGAINTPDLPGGTAEQRRIICYDDTDADVHPVRRAAEDQAYVDAVKWTGDASSYWTVQGIWINNASVNCGSVSRTHHNIFDFCVIEECSVYGLRMLATHHTYTQRCVIRNITRTSNPGDAIGVQYKNIDEIDDVDTVENFNLDNEYVNCGDAVAFTEAVTKYQGVSAICEGNDCYIETSEYLGDTNTMWQENAFDLKCGSDDHRSAIRKNRMWGYRRNAAPTALGELIVIQKYCRNLDVEDNFGADAPRGMKDENWPNDQYGFTATASTNTINDVGHGLSTGAGPLTITSSGGTLPAGLASSTPYWAIKIDADHFRFASSRANAIAETAIDFTTDGTGTMRWRSQIGASRDIAFRRNQWKGIRDYASEDTGAVYLPITDISFEDEVVADSTYAFQSAPSVYYDPTFNNFTLRDVAALQRPEDQTPALPWDAAQHTIVPAPVFPVVYDVIQVKRWTGPEWMACATVVTEDTPQPTVRTRTQLFVTPSPKRQAVRYGASRRTARR